MSSTKNGCDETQLRKNKFNEETGSIISLTSSESNDVEYVEVHNSSITLSSDESVVVTHDFNDESVVVTHDFNNDENNKQFVEDLDTDGFDNDNDNNIHIHVQSDVSDDNVSDVNVGNTMSWKKVESPTGWTSSMKRYYNKPSRRQRYFDWRSILAQIRSGPSTSWHILHNDIYPVANRRGRCLICRQFDHLSYNCPRQTVHCSMCGLPGHSYYKCPQRMCLNCGMETSDFVSCCRTCFNHKYIKCKRCDRYGHDFYICPDLWRSFHRTTEHMEINFARPVLNKNAVCCNCAKPGHIFENCREPYWSTYSPTSSFVKPCKDFTLDGYSSSSSSNRNKSIKKSLKRSLSEDESLGMLKRYKHHRKNKKPKSSNSSKKDKLLMQNPLEYFKSLLKKKKKKRKKKRKSKNKEDDN